mgnify:CR=1 FL=1
MAREGHRNEGFGWGFVLGLVAGSVLALIFAPQSGEQTRRQIADRASEFKGSAQELIEQALQNLEEAATKAGGVLGTKEKSIRRKIDELRSELEKFELERA